EDNLKPWQDLKGTEVSPLGVSFFNARTPSNSTIDIALFGVPANSFLAPPGQARESLAGPPGVVLSKEFENQGLKVGDELTIVGPDVTLPILGFTYTGSYGHVEIAFTSLTEWQDLLYGKDARGRFSAIAIKAPDGTDFTAVDKLADTETRTKVEAYAGSPGFSEEQGTMSLIRVFLLAISALIVGAFFTVWTIQRTRQIGLLKALGASNAYILRDALGQLAVILVASTAVGALLAVITGLFIGPNAPFSLKAGPVLTSSVILIVLGMIGSLVSIRKVTSVDPIIAMGAE
ncbi:MAG TPA: ABC transporter permease, partial [Microthrixaceae bacterium]|nr:ABC transporter permease [Microthrixaceae bacterium]